MAKMTFSFKIIQVILFFIVIISLSLNVMLLSKHLKNTTNQNNKKLQHLETTNSPHAQKESPVNLQNNQNGAAVFKRDSLLDPADFGGLSRQTNLSDIFISVKTTQRLHSVRLDVLLDTWVQLARPQTYFFTDGQDKEYQKKTGGHLINTKCSYKHDREGLCCKMAAEYDAFIASKKRWFCHVDDDTYVNIPKLSRLLQKYNHTEDWYLGKNSMTFPLKLVYPESNQQRYSFWFATGGAGFCLSQGLALKMLPYAGGTNLLATCTKILLPDDCTIGFIIYYYLKQQLTVVNEFHSHLEDLYEIKAPDLEKQITFSYYVQSWINNVVHVSGFDEKKDPSRFRSIHCQLFPSVKGCPLASS